MKAYTTDLKVLLKEVELDCIPAEDFEDVGLNWLTANREAVAPKTTLRRLTSLRAFAKWAGWACSFDDYIAPIPHKGQPHPIPEGIEGVRRMIAVATEDHHKALVALCGLVGMRVAEAIAVRPSHIDLNEMMVEIRGKGDKMRLVPVSEECWEVIQMPVTRAFLTGQDAQVVGLKDRFARAVVTNLAVRAGLSRHVASHDLRATFATEVYNKTLDQRLVQYLLGHSSAEQTSIYIGRSATQLREGVRL